MATTSAAPTARPQKRAVVYLRVSTSRKAKRGEDPDGYSLKAQREGCYHKALDLKAAVVEEYIDRDHHATTASRPSSRRALDTTALQT